MADVAVAVVVCTRDRPELLRGIVPALVHAQAAGAEVVVVDSASRGPETRTIAEEAGLRVLRCDLPGASRARNAGLAATSAPVVAFTDDDCRPHPGWEAVFAAAFADEKVGFATGRVLPGTGSGRAMSPMLEEAPAAYTAADPVDDMGHGACMAFRRSAIESVGGFDEVLGAGGPLYASEEKDLFWRVLRAGWEGRYVPDAVVDHAAWRGHSESLRNGFRYGVGIGALVAKVARLEGRGATGPVLRRASASVRQTGSTIRLRYKFATIDLMVRAVGILVGGVRARRYPVVDGRFVG
jgi:glycosyltransferase involved in cell wall biosynthesis